MMLLYIYDATVSYCIFKHYSLLPCLFIFNSTKNALGV